MIAAAAVAIINRMHAPALDAALWTWVVAHRVSALNPLFLALTTLGGNGIIWGALAILLAAVKRAKWRDVLLMAAALVVTMITADQILKPLVNRPRPFAVLPHADVLGRAPRDASFPSGHSADAGAGALVLSRLCPEASIAWWVLAAAIGYSRVYVGVHYPSDVVAGLLVGAACAWFVMAIGKKGRVTANAASR